MLESNKNREDKTDNSSIQISIVVYRYVIRDVLLSRVVLYYNLHTATLNTVLLEQW